NVSHICPAIHPNFSISEGQELTAHTKEFAQATLTETAYKNAAKTIGSLVLTGVDIIKDEDLLKSIKDEFDKVVKI
ncbi:MAG TPA: amidohydrolase, partial [Tissierellaceae bacterium]|nr:amidohydrolase [Tissierellaceae bacterium]